MQRRAEVLAYNALKTSRRHFFQIFSVRIHLSVLYFTKCDLRIKVLIQKSILVFYAIRRIEMLTSSSSNEKAALMKLEMYLDQGYAGGWGNPSKNPS